MATLYPYLSARVPGHICGWLPLNVSRRGNMPATPRRIAWAIREIGRSGYPGLLAAEALGGHPAPSHLAESVASVDAVMAHR